MVSTYTLNQGIEKPATGDQSGTWGGTVNTNMDIIDRAISGVGALTLTGSTTTLTTTDGTLTDGMFRVLVLGDSGDLGSDNTITISPNDADKLYLVYNNLSANRNAIFSQGSGANATIENGETAWVYADGAGSGAAVRVATSSTKLLDQDGDTGIRVEEGGDDDDTIRFDVAGAEDFTMTANTLSVLSGSTLNIDSGATIANSGTATGFGGGGAAYTGVLQTNANFVDQVIFGPSVDGMSWNGLWDKSSVFSSLMLATIEDEGSNTEINIWDLTEESAGTISTTPLATVDLASAATPTAVHACMGYVIVGSEDGIAIIDPHSGAWAERTAGWPKTLSSSTVPALTNNDVEGVYAGLSDQPVHDPRTGGPLPTFACSYGTGADIGSVIKTDGNVYDKAATIDNGAICIISNGKVGFGGAAVDRLDISQPGISSIVADDWDISDLGGSSGDAPSLGFQNAIAESGNLIAGADGSGLSLIKGAAQSGIVTNPVNVTRASNLATVQISRSHNTGYMQAKIKGSWLANSNTVDYSGNTNTLTQTGSITEAAVASGAELKGYSGFTDAIYLARTTTDSDYNALGTGAAYWSIWFKCSGNSAAETLCEVGKSDNTIKFNIRLAADGTIAAIDDGATASVSTDSTDTFDDGEWHKVDFFRVSNVERYLYVDSILKASNLTDAGSLSESTMRVALGGATNLGVLPATTSVLALAHLSTTTPSPESIRDRYDAEKGMFEANAECLLQSGSTDAVLDVDIDPLTGKVLVTQTDAITVFESGGLVVDSKPTVNSGASEKGKLWGDLRAEQNSANAYVTAPATDQRQVNEMVRSLSSDLPKGVDLSKAAAWVVLDPPTPAIVASYNIESIVDRASGTIMDIHLAVKLKGKIGDSATLVSAGDNSGNQYAVYDGDPTVVTGGVVSEHTIIFYNTSGSLSQPDRGTMVLFGELENE